MPSSFMGMSKAYKINDILVPELKLYFQAKHASKNDKITIVVTIVKENDLTQWA